ncbi:ABC transporter permease [Sphaerimonospora cavernae]|uniref:ABC transporter permease n=1 Tax=Sphaerimonospora cavernae TaxID=1740611 RepID=A0ABV6U4T1_9ACTN
MLLVAGREIRTQVRTKGFFVGLAVTVVLIVGITLAPKLLGGPDSYTVGLVASQKLDVPGSGDVELEWRTYSDEAAARRAVLDGDVDAAMIGGTAAIRVLSDGEIDTELGLMLQAAHREAQIQAAGVRTTPLSMESIGVDTRYEESRSQMAFMLVLILFMLVVGTPMMVAMGVVEEKGSRIVEILFTSVRPWQLLGGKVLGLGVVGLINLVVVLAAGLAAAFASGLAVDFPPGMAGIVAGIVVWFVLGYAFFAAVAAALASLVSRQEEVANVLTPMTMTMFASYGVAAYAAKEPTSLVATIASYVPPFSSMVMPVRATAAATPAWEILLSGALMTAAVAGTVLFAARVYERAVLRTGARVRLREVVGSR